MRIEIAHDALAKKIYEKGSSEDKMLLRVLRLVNERFEAYAETKTYLSRQELHFIAPFEDHLDDLLGKAQYDFTLHSKVFRRRQLLTVFVFVVLVVIGLVSGLLYSNMLRQNAEMARKETIQQSQSNRLVTLAMQNEEVAPALALKLTLAAKDLTKDDVGLDKLARLIFRRNSFSNNELVHKGVVYGTAFAPDGQTIATASMDKMIHIWDLNGNLKSTLLGHTRMVNDVDFSPDGSKIISASDDSTAIIWNAKKGNIIKVLKKHKADVNAAKFSPNGKYILTGSRDKTAILWSSEGEYITTLTGHRNIIYDVDFSPLREDLIATASRDSTVKIWNINTKRNIVTLKHPHSVHGVTFSPKNLNEVASGCRDDNARIWNLNTNEEVSVLKGHTSSVINIDYSPSGDTLLTGSWDNTARLWDIEKETTIRELVGHTDFVLGLAYSPKGDHIATGGRDNVARLWDLDLKRCTKSFVEQTDRIQSVAFSNDLRYCLTGSWDNTVILWNVINNKKIQTYKLPSDVEAVDFHPSNRAFAVASGSKIYLYHVGRVNPSHTYVGHTKTVKSIKFNKKGDRMLSGGRDGTAIYWDVWNHKIRKVLKKHKRDILSVCYNSSQDRLITSSWDKTITIWDTLGKEIKTLSNHSDKIYSISASSTSDKLLSADLNGSVRLWNIKTGEVLQTWNTNNSVYSIQFVPGNDELFIVAGADNQAKLWNTEGHILQIFEQNSDILDIDIASDMSYLLVGTKEEGAHIFYTLEGFLSSNHFEDITVLDKIKFKLIEVKDIQFKTKYNKSEIEILRKLATYLEEEGLKLEKIIYLEKAKIVHDKILALDNHMRYDKEQAATLYAALALFELKSKKVVSANSRNLILKAFDLAPKNSEVLLMKGNFNMIDGKPLEAKTFYKQLKGQTYGRNIPMTRKAVSELNDLMQAGLVTKRDFDTVKDVLKSK